MISTVKLLVKKLCFLMRQRLFLEGIEVVPKRKLVPKTKMYPLQEFYLSFWGTWPVLCEFETSPVVAPYFRAIWCGFHTQVLARWLGLSITAWLLKNSKAFYQAVYENLLVLIWGCFGFDQKVKWKFYLKKHKDNMKLEGATPLMGM